MRELTLKSAQSFGKTSLILHILHNNHSLPTVLVDENPFVNLCMCSYRRWNCSFRALKMRTFSVEQNIPTSSLHLRHCIEIVTYIFLGHWMF
jgi:hypothetical protein